MGEGTRTWPYRADRRQSPHLPDQGTPGQGRHHRYQATPHLYDRTGRSQSATGQHVAAAIPTPDAVRAASSAGSIAMGGHSVGGSAADGRIVVEHDDRELLDVPLVWSPGSCASGPVAVSAGLRNWALVTDVDLIFCSQRCPYLGQTSTGHIAC